MDFDENDSPDFVVPHLFDTYTLSGLLWHTEEKVRTLIDELPWSHYTPTLPLESLFEDIAQKSPPPTVSSYVDFLIMNYKKRKKWNRTSLAEDSKLSASGRQPILNFFF